MVDPAPAKTAAAEIITIGTEILLGDIVDTNAAHMARVLRDLGLDVYRTSSVGDNPARIAACVREGLARSQVVITSGGLGPTIDDATRQGIALAAGRELVFIPSLWQQIQDRFAHYGRTPSDNNRRQAFIPQGAQPIENPVGTAPAFMLQAGEAVLFALPGVPSEMKALLETVVVPDLKRRLGLEGIIKSRLLRTAGVGESVLDALIADLEQLTNPTVGLAAHPASVDIRITAKAEAEAEADRMLAEVEAEVEQRLGVSIYGKDQVTLGAALGALLQAGNLTLCGVEVGSGGRLAAHLMACGPACLGVLVLPDGTGGTMEDALARFHQERRAAAALGLCLRPNEGGHQVDIAWILEGRISRLQHRYGGPPASAPAWAANLAADALRRALLDIPSAPR